MIRRRFMIRPVTIQVTPLQATTRATIPVTDRDAIRATDLAMIPSLRCNHRMARSIHGRRAIVVRRV